MIANPIFVYGPPGSGKSTIGRLLAQRLHAGFLDLDQLVEGAAGRTIPEIFAAGGESEFRRLEKKALTETAGGREIVVALGGGALLDSESRALVERSGRVVVLDAAEHILSERLSRPGRARPLLDSAGDLATLLASRHEHYSSFPLHVDTAGFTPEQAAWEIQKCLGMFVVSGMGAPYPVRIQRGLALEANHLLHTNDAPAVIVTDSNVAPLHLDRVRSALEQAAPEVHTAALPAGETSKSVDGLARLWETFGRARLERDSAIVALGGGTVSDLAGFAAATYLRGLAWYSIPTTLLAMVDAAIGGKTGVNLPLGKNLAGAFHAPAAVWVDPDFLETLPESELANGLAELFKNAVIGDSRLFALCQAGRSALSHDWTRAISQAAAVKIELVEVDPYERGPREALNFGHTVGHALERLSGYSISHGIAVTTGMVLESLVGVRCGVTPKDIATSILSAIRALDLRLADPRNYSPPTLAEAMQSDKKRKAGRIRFSLPAAIGAVRTGVSLDSLEETLAASLTEFPR